MKTNVRQLAVCGLLSLAAATCGYSQTAAPDFATANVLTVLEPMVVTNLVTLVQTNVVVETITDSRISETTNLVTRTFTLRNIGAEEVASRINAMWTGDFGSVWKIGKVAQPFADANKVIVTAPRSVIESCEEIVREVDVEPQQVYIEARFVELGSTAMHKLGIDWSMFDGMKGSATMGAGINSYNVGKGVENYSRTVTDSSGTTTYNIIGGTKTGTQNGFVGDDNGTISHFSGTLDFSEMYLVMSALERENDTRIFSNPRIIVSGGRKATVDMTTKYPNVTVSAKRTINGTADSLDLAMNMAAIPGEDKFMFAKEAFFSWGISLEVTPRVGTNGVINVTIVPTISSQSDWVSAGASDTSTKSKADNIGSYSAKYPVIDVQRLVTEFSMKSGTTAVIGGLSRTTEEQMDSGIPYLRDIPWIGNKLFGGKSRQKVQKEILVFVTVGLAKPSELPADVGLPRNAVLGREYTEGKRKEPGDRRSGAAGVTSLDLRPLDEQAKDPQWTNRVDDAELRFPVPFTKKK